MEDLSAEEIVDIHHRIMMEGKGDCRIISEANLHQMVFGANLLQDCIPRAAFIFYSLCAYPAFREGNTETALAVTQQVLVSGGYRITGEISGILALADGIIGFTTEPEEIEQWISDHVTESISRQSSVNGL
jgi:prophage maintenance system killer protein